MLSHFIVQLRCRNEILTTIRENMSVITFKKDRSKCHDAKIVLDDHMPVR